MSSLNNLQQHIPEQLRTKSLTLNSVIKGRTTQRFNPMNGKSGYSGDGKSQIEFNLAHSDLVDFSTLALSLKYTQPGSNAGHIVDGFISGLFQYIEVYIADKLFERVERYAIVKHAMIKATSNDSYVVRELDAMSTVKAGKTDYITSLDLLGITKIKNYLPLLQNNVRIVIKLATSEVSHVSTKSILAGENAGNASGPRVAVSDYQLDDVTMLLDTVQVHDGYMANFMSAISGETGITIPIQTFDVKERTYSELMHFNLSYAEADSFFGIVKYANTEKTHDTNPVTVCDFPQIKKLTASFSGKYVTPVDGLQTKSEIYMSMRKSLASLHDASGSTYLDFNGYNDLTLLGCDLEKVPAHAEVVGNGLDTRANSYTLDVKVETSSEVKANAKFYLVVLHRKLLVFANNSITIQE